MPVDYWLDPANDINSLEAKALLHSLLAFRDHIRDSRVDVHSDNLTIKATLNNFGCRSSSVNESVKEILQCGRRYNFAINVHYVLSRDNLGDAPSRASSDLDCTLSEKAWDLVERHFGPHSFDLMSFDRCDITFTFICLLSWSDLSSGIFWIKSFVGPLL